MLLNSKLLKLVITSGFVLFFTTNISAHCDSIEGPVVKAAKKALETGNINHALIWVRADDESEVKSMFDKVMKVRDINEDVRELSDMYFFETLVRVHRMGEGVGYTGLKLEDFKPAEGIEAADRAIESGSVVEILTHVEEDQHAKIKEYFAELQAKKKYDVNDIAAGRDCVESYVHFIHFIEGLFGGENIHHEESDKTHLH